MNLLTLQWILLQKCCIRLQQNALLSRNTIKKRKTNHIKIKKWFDKECENLKATVMSAAKDLVRYPSDPIVRGRYYKLRKEYNKLVEHKEHAFRENLLNKVSLLESSNPKTFWEIVKKLRSSKTSNPADNIVPHEWHEWLKNLNSTSITSSDAEKSISSLVKRAKNFAASNHLLDKVINDEEIIKASKQLKNGKSVVNDAICNKMIKCLVHTKFINVIRMLFNVILTRTYFPSSWKVNYIIPIFKSDDSFDPNNYRGISVSSCLGKLFTLVTNARRLIKFLDIANTLSSFQIGFRRGYRTSDHVFVLNTIINGYFSKGKKVYACFVDFSKAYDSVWRKGLLYKLILNGLSIQFISLIDSMYSELKAAVKLSNGITPFFNSAVGVRQGRNLSPLLFNIFVNDIFDIFDDLKCCPVKLNNKPITSLMYADDLLILSETEDGLKESLQRLGKYAKQWKMKISAKKTKIMVFNKQGRKLDMKVKLDDLVIESCEQYPYLGTASLDEII